MATRIAFHFTIPDLLPSPILCHEYLSLSSMATRIAFPFTIPDLLPSPILCHFLSTARPNDPTQQTDPLPLPFHGKTQQPDTDPTQQTDPLPLPFHGKPMATDPTIPISNSLSFHSSPAQCRSAMQPTQPVETGPKWKLSEVELSTCFLIILAKLVWSTLRLVIHYIVHTEFFLHCVIIVYCSVLFTNLVASFVVPNINPYIFNIRIPK
ncbi:uncharacterized protein LOC115974302 [Quercus lobata]|uniref:uncharacterized protein LOC115974302 n=1 Tax=Quercus lobata TaxID=97700 RepID=UPI001245C3D9|nr:uncharacterized protein LOC115974302 [Quercus lobata]